MIREAFYSRIDIENAQRIFKGERIFIQKRIDDIKNQLKNFRQFKQKLESKGKDGVIDIDDL